MLNNVTIEGNLTRDPELRFTPAGKAVANIGIAVNKRRKVGDTWEDGPAQFFDVTCWEQLAENVAESLQKGNTVTVAGELQFRSWEDADGNTRSKVTILAQSVTPSLRWATVEVTRNAKRDKGAAPAQAATAPYDADEEPF